jgi:predicted transcriptional regulator of viral defense system
MNNLAGLGKKSRERLALLMRSMKGVISLKDAASILKMPEAQTATFVSRLCKNGWLSRIRRGMYIPVSIESKNVDPVSEDPWAIAQRLFEPCYIGGWSAAEHWDLTEQIFRSVLVVTARKVRSKQIEAGGTEYFVKMTTKEKLFGTTEVWKNNAKVKVSDPSKTIIDVLNDPEIGGGIRPVFDLLKNYLSSKNKNFDLLVQYGEKTGNGAIFKRLGFLVEKKYPQEKSFLERCQLRISKGYSKLDPALKGDKIISKWKLWIPASWVDGNLND